jgi:hypothetical protein
MQSKRFEMQSSLVNPGLVFLREQKPFSIRQDGCLKWLSSPAKCWVNHSTTGLVERVRVNYGLPRGALNSAVECHLHTVEVAGSNPAAPTITSLQSMVYLLIDSGLHWRLPGTARSGLPIPVAKQNPGGRSRYFCPWRVKQS